MKSNEVYVAVGVAVAAAFGSWVFSCEVLFIMGVIITAVLADIVGLVLGSITLSERLTLSRVRAREEWGMRARTSTSR